MSPSSWGTWKLIILRLFRLYNEAKDMLFSALTSFDVQSETA
jgi:hypothetical protein